MTTPPYFGMYRPSSPSTYESEISFVETPDQILHEKLFFVKFRDSNIRDSMYKDDSGYLHRLFVDGRVNGKIDDPDIESIQRVLRYYAYIKVISDPQAPDRNGNYYIIPFGNKIFTIINNFIDENTEFGNTRNTALMYERVFKFSVVPMSTYGGRFPNYDKSHFTNQVCDHEFEPSNKISDTIKHPVYKIPSRILRETRRKKMEEIFKNNPI